MTFDEWMDANVGTPPYSLHSRRLWAAATEIATVAERERCLDVIRGIADILADDTPENMKRYGDADVVLLRTVMAAITDPPKGE